MPVSENDLNYVKHRGELHNKMFRLMLSALGTVGVSYGFGYIVSLPMAKAIWYVWVTLLWCIPAFVIGVVLTINRYQLWCAARNEFFRRYSK